PPHASGRHAGGLPRRISASGRGLPLATGDNRALAHRAVLLVYSRPPRARLPGGHSSSSLAIAARRSVDRSQHYDRADRRCGVSAPAPDPFCAPARRDCLVAGADLIVVVTASPTPVRGRRCYPAQPPAL